MNGKKYQKVEYNNVNKICNCSKIKYWTVDKISLQAVTKNIFNIVITLDKTDYFFLLTKKTDCNPMYHFSFTRREEEEEEEKISVLFCL